MKRVLLLLSNGFEVYEASVFSDVFGFAKSGGVDVELGSVGFHKNLTCAYGFKVIPNNQVSKVNINKFDALAIPGGTRDAGFYEDAYSEGFLEIIREFNQQGKYIAAVCTGAMPLAKSGILKGRKATSYAGKRQEELKYLGVIVPNEDLAIDKNIITCSSPARALEVSFTLLELLTSKENRKQTEAWFGIK